MKNQIDFICLSTLFEPFLFQTIYRKCCYAALTLLGGRRPPAVTVRNCSSIWKLYCEKCRRFRSHSVCTLLSTPPSGGHGGELRPNVRRPPAEHKEEEGSVARIDNSSVNRRRAQFSGVSGAASPGFCPAPLRVLAA